jgi:DNA polymerase-3 subunit alpha
LGSRATDPGGGTEAERVVEKTLPTAAYIRIPPQHEDGEVLQSLKQVLLRHRGNVPVYLYYERTKKVLALPVSKYGIRPSEECRARIEEILGKRTFRLKEPPPGGR